MTRRNISDFDVDEALLQRANNLLCRINRPYPCYVAEVGLEHFVALYETIIQEKIPGSGSAKTLWEKEMVCQFVIDSLADDVFQLSLDHITGYEVVNGNRKCISDLLDIFEVLVDYEENQKNDDAAEVDENKNCLQVLPTPIRETLLDLEENACYLSKTTTKEPRTVKSEFTQTTPVSVMSSTTSPHLPNEVWADILKQSKDRMLQDRKWQSEPRSAKSVNVTFKPATKNTRTERKPSSSNKNPGIQYRPKPVISTKLRHNSSSTTRQKCVLQRTSSLTASHGKKVQKKESVASRRNRALESSIRPGKKGAQFNDACYDINYIMKLLDDAEKIRSRRHEINKQIRQLEEEDKALRTVESILLKEIKYVQQIRKTSKFGPSISLR